MSLSQPLFSEDRMHYETPQGGTTVGGYVSRRLHKTSLLNGLPELIAASPTQALARLALYAAAASTSYGPALYQPDRDPSDRTIESRDPETGARVSVTHHGRLRYAYRVELSGIGALTGEETITGTSAGLHGLDMPAPSVFHFAAVDNDYQAELQGIITSELAPRIGRWRIRGFGQLSLSDNRGNKGRLTLDRSGLVAITITDAQGRKFQLMEKLAG